MREASIRHGRSVLALSLAALGSFGISVQGAPLPTTMNDFVMPGTQPNTLGHEIQLSTNCFGCHSDYDPAVEPGFQWKGSLMAQAGRDPLFYAAVTVANQDAPGSGEMCIRCHLPRGWLGGRSTPPDGSALTADDRDSINCAFCHEMVDPINPHGDAPAEDAAILAALGPMLPTSLHNASFVIDPDDTRQRGPFGDPLANHQWLESPFHTRSEFCATCHDVSNPAFSKQPDGTYAANAWDTPAPDITKTEVFPIERTYSEWSQSAFAAGPIEMGGRFGGNKTAVSTCQDCHMPDASGKACDFFGLPSYGRYRDDLPLHTFLGASTWVLDAVASLYPNEVDAAALTAAKQRNIQMLQLAATMELAQISRTLRVRVTNETGHKLPSGYPEGRRIWLEVVFKDQGDVVVGQHGHYDAGTADLDVDSTKVYEVKLGVDSTVSGLTGVPAGESFHFVLNNYVVKDNRIPPRGFTNANFEAVQAGHVNYHYEDGAYWDDSYFTMPAGAVTAEVTLHYQASSKEYITFLRDTNVTDTTGQTVYDQWELHGKGAPVTMLSDNLGLADLDYGDFDNNGVVSQDDFGFLQMCLSGADVDLSPVSCAPADSEGDGDVDMDDVVAFQASHETGEL